MSTWREECEIREDRSGAWYVEQFLAVLSKRRTNARDGAAGATLIAAIFDQPDKPSYIDNMMPNRLGITKSSAGIITNPGFWPKLSKRLRAFDT